MLTIYNYRNFFIRFLLVFVSLIESSYFCIAKGDKVFCVKGRVVDSKTHEPLRNGINVTLTFNDSIKITQSVDSAGSFTFLTTFRSVYFNKTTICAEQTFKPNPIKIQDECWGKVFQDHDEYFKNVINIKKERERNISDTIMVIIPMVKIIFERELPEIIFKENSSEYDLRFEKKHVDSILKGLVCEAIKRNLKIQVISSSFPSEKRFTNLTYERAMKIRNALISLGFPKEKISLIELKSSEILNAPDFHANNQLNCSDGFLYCYRKVTFRFLLSD